MANNHNSQGYDCEIFRFMVLVFVSLLTMLPDLSIHPSKAKVKVFGGNHNVIFSHNYVNYKREIKNGTTMDIGLFEKKSNNICSLLSYQMSRSGNLGFNCTVQ